MRMRFHFWTDCFGMPGGRAAGDVVNAIKRHPDERSISYATFVRHADLRPLRDADHPAMYRISAPDNWSVSFHRSRLPSGAPVYYFAWSGIEHFFVEDEPDIEEEIAALDAAESMTPNGRWGSFIGGEWWLTEHGSEFADQDVGDQGHEGIAVNNLWDADAALEKAKELAEEASAAEDEDREEEMNDLVGEIEENLSEEYGSSSVFFNVNLPDEVGQAGCASPEIWRDLKKDARLAYAKHAGAIQVVGNNFYAWTVTSDKIRIIQDHLAEQLAEAGLDEMPAEDIWVEEGSTGRSVSMTASDFMLLKHPRDLWATAYQPNASGAPRFDASWLLELGEPTFDFFDPAEEEAEVEDEFPETRRVRRVSWGFRPGRMMKVDPAYVRPMPENIFYENQIASIYHAIKQGGAVLHPPAARVSFVDETDVEESQQAWEDGRIDELGISRPWEASDVGKPFVTLVNGNHRAFAAILAGEPAIWVYVNEGYRERAADYLENARRRS